jgi:hypothetical protein
MVIEYSIVHKFYYKDACNFNDSMPKLCSKVNGILDSKLRYIAETLHRILFALYKLTSGRLSLIISVRDSGRNLK